MTTASAAEIAKFDALANGWWDPGGPMRMLHRMNPLRVGWVAGQARAGGRLLDVGCGAGLAAEAFAREGFVVTGIDAAPTAIGVARAHAAEGGLAIDYRIGDASMLAGERFDVVTALEVIEHVEDQPGFVRTLAGLLASGGVLALSTLNRTASSFAVAIVGAEYVVRLVPTGTHDWRRFVTPAELGRMTRAAGLSGVATKGMRYNPVTGGWSLAADCGVNYLLSARAA